MLVTWTKDTISNIKDTIPLISKLVIDNLKEKFNENGQNVLNDLNGTLGIVVKLFGQQLLNNYFDKLSEKKLINFGLGVYFKAAITQAEESLKHIDSINLDTMTRKSIVERFEEIYIENLQNIDSSNLILSFTPKNHPAVSMIRTVCESILEEYITEPHKFSIINSFTKNFNENIEARIVSEFGSDYDKHIREVDEKWIKSKEGKLLNDMLALSRIGFAEHENLKYQETYAYWNNVDDYRSSFDRNTSSELEEFEKTLSPIGTLIETYFNRGEDSIEKLLFIIADFGKGKSVYLKYKASLLARQYEQRGQGFIPIYFNLRDFDTYDQNSSFGVISDFLGKKYGIDVQDMDFQKNDYFFLIDSLDECGNLTEERIDRVVTSIKKIQNINIKMCRNNRIIITSRPIEHSLIKHLNANDPYKINNDQSRPINQYVSIYGFKKEQFNDSIIDSLRKSLPLNPDEFTGISGEIIQSITDVKNIDIYKYFTDTKLLTASELRRPIFSYMIYKLIMNKTDLTSTNKIGVYLSFINVLTKEAKYINAMKEVNLKDEYKFRNILHATAALWMYETYRGNQGFLKKHDISNTIEGSLIDKSDSVKMKKYKEIEDVEFLSQSYFGQKGDTFYFQHQSFAEILLAEYYLKIFIHFALNDSSTTEDVRLRLMLGNPTEQTIDFLVGLLLLLKESASTNENNVIINKRKLIFPMLASLSTPEFSKGLFSQYLKYKWFEKESIDSNSVEPPAALLINWPITDEVINKIIRLALDILNSKSKFILTTLITEQTSLFNSEVIQLNDDLSSIPPDIDRWIALLIGNKLFNNENEKKFFASKVEDCNIFFSMFNNWNKFSNIASPGWGRSLFRGLSMSGDSRLKSELSKSPLFTKRPYQLTGLILDHIDFSYSTLIKVTFEFCSFFNCKFENASLHLVDFSNSALPSVTFNNTELVYVQFSICTLWDSNFENLQFNGLSFELCQIAQGVYFPSPLNELLKASQAGLVDYGGKAYLGAEIIESNELSSIFTIIEPFIIWIIRNHNTELHTILEWFIFEDEHIKSEFELLLNQVVAT